MGEVQFTPLAAEDLARVVAESLGQFGPAQARHYMDELEQWFASLVEFPHLGRAVPGHRGVRRSEIGAHVVFYRLTGGDVLIVRILPVHQLPSEHL